MADDVVIGSGASTPADFTAAADEIAGKKYQRVKVSVGDDGTAADVGPSNPMPISGAMSIAGTMPVSVAVGQEVDGHSASIGTTTDAAASTTGSVIAQLRRIANLLAAALPLPTGASTSAKQPALGTAGTASADVITVQGKSGMTPLDVQGAITVTGTMPIDSSKIEDAAHVSGDTGAFVLAVRNDAGTALATTTGDYIPLSTDSVGNLRTAGAVTNAGTFAVQPTIAAATTATLTSTAASASNVANLVALNTNRTGLFIHNDSSAILYIKYGTTASTSSFTVLIPANTLWEMPATPRYTGRIDGIWASATGNARITELTP